MGEFKILGKNEIGDWYGYYENLAKKGVYHNPDYIRWVSGHFNGEPELLLFIEDNNYIYYPYIKRRIGDLPDFSDSNYTGYFDIISSWYYGGPLLKKEDDRIIQDFIDRFSRFRKENNIISEFIRYDPNLKNYDVVDDLSPDFNRRTVYVDLTNSEETIWDEFEKRNRTSIRKAEKEGVEIEESTTDTNIEKFTEIYLEEMGRKDADEHYYFDADEFKNILKKLKEKFRLFITRYEGKFVGGGIVMRENGIAHDYLRATLQDYWDYYPNNLLLYEELIWCRQNGDKVFDLQGGRPGVFNFKKAFSPERGEFYISKHVHNKSMYRTLLDEAAKMGIDTSKDFFPEYRAKK